MNAWLWAGLACVAILVVLEVCRFLRELRLSYPEAPPQHAWWRWQWSQDGWVRKCKLCGALQYGGEDYDGGPDVSGHVEAGPPTGPRA